MRPGASPAVPKEQIVPPHCMIRLGIIDFDSSHSVEFTRRFNRVGVERDQYVDGARVVAGWPGTSSMSPERIPGFSEQVKACGVELVDSPELLLGRIDAVLVLSLCGAAHLERVRPFLQAGVPAFVDKPFACTVDDAREMLRLADENNVLLWSSSGMRFSDEVAAFRSKGEIYGPLNGVVSYGPAKRADGNPGLLHYGIHAAEVLFTLMGPGCERVATAYTDGAEVVTGEWRDGRIGTLRGTRHGSTAYGFLAFCQNGVVSQPVSARNSYRNLCREIVRAFECGKPPVPPQTTLELLQFILAASESERRGGEFVALDSIG